VRRASILLLALSCFPVAGLAAPAPKLALAPCTTVSGSAGLPAGTYKDPESGYGIRVEILGDHLRAVELGEEATMVLVATSPTHFRVEGRTDTATFQVMGGRATAVLLEQPGTPSITLRREGM
jgi:hypothetical protein